MTTNHNYQQLNLKNQNKLSIQPEQEQNQRYGYKLEGYQWRGGRGRVGEKIQELRSKIGRQKLGEY